MARRSPRRLNLPIPPNYADLHTTFDVLLRALAEIDRDLDSDIELDTARITSGTFADARIAASNVTQHQAALSITESQIADLQAYLLDITGESILELMDVPADPNADSLLLWDDSLGVTDWITEIPDSFLSVNVPLKNAENTFSEEQRFTSGRLNFRATGDALKIQCDAITLNDDATGTTVLDRTIGMAFITSNFSADAAAVIVFNGTTIVAVHEGSRVSIGTAGVNPDVDGNVNIWMNPSGTLNIKNRLGSARSFPVYAFLG